MQKLFTLLALLAAVTFLPSRLAAQDTGNAGQSNEPSASTTSVATAACKRGTKAGRSCSPRTMGRSTTCAAGRWILSEHVGHTVTRHRPRAAAPRAGGQAPSSSSSPNATSEAAQSGEGQGGGHGGGGHMLIVTDLKMVSDSCKK